MSSEKNQVTLLCMYHFALYLRHYKNQISWYLRLQSPCLNFLDTLMGLGVRFFSSTYFGQFPKQANLLIWLCWYIQLYTFGLIFSVCGRIFQEEEESDGFYQSLGNLESKSKKIERENYGSWKRRGTFLIFKRELKLCTYSCWYCSGLGGPWWCMIFLNFAHSYTLMHNAFSPFA